MLLKATVRRAATVDGVYTSRRPFVTYSLRVIHFDSVWAANGTIPALKVMFCSGTSRSRVSDGLFGGSFLCRFRSSRFSQTLQVWMVTVFLHCWQRTEQHQENLQEHRCTTSARPALYPGPQHTSSHPSGASRDVPVLQKTGGGRGPPCWFFFFPFGGGCWGQPYRYISCRRSQGYRSRDRDGRNLGRVQGRGDLWQQGVSPGGPEAAGLF